MFESEGRGPIPFSRVSFSVSKDDNWSIRPAHSRRSVPAPTPLTLETLFGTIAGNMSLCPSGISENPPVTTWTRSVLLFLADRGSLRKEEVPGLNSTF